ncbi:MAG: hypothetical protein V9G13_14285 [Marmoricola sp.]|jgi:hypothetical protein|nr:hypothetical protein [Nocardioidaceae bacterium]
MDEIAAGVEKVKAQPRTWGIKAMIIASVIALFVGGLGGLVVGFGAGFVASTHFGQHHGYYSPYWMDDRDDWGEMPHPGMMPPRYRDQQQPQAPEISPSTNPTAAP